MMTPKIWVPSTVLMAALTVPLLTGAAAAGTGTAAPTRAKTSTPMVTVRDPVEGAFTVQMPQGWKNQAYTVRLYDLHRAVVTSLSPDGKTVLFSGDPRLPGYYIPTPEMNENSEIASYMNPLTKFSGFVPAETYFTDYVKKKFGKLPGFRITKTAPNPALMEIFKKGMKRNNMMAARGTTTLLAFDYKENGKTMHSVINGLTMQMGTIWIATVSGVSTTGDPSRYNALLLRMEDSARTDPRWKAKQQALHEARMAQLRQDHANMVASFSASNQRHQLRMQAIQAAGDAGMKNWYEKQAAGDATHRQFLNVITEENTVISPSTGRAFQVDNSHERYFVNRRDNTYIGTKSATDLNDLRRMQGINPDDYEEVKIKR